MGFLRDVGEFVAGIEDLALTAGGDGTAAMRLAARTNREVVVFVWSLIGGRAQPWADIDPRAWRDAWVAIFRQISLTSNGQLAQRPTGSGVLYRGCGPGGKFGLSWTSSPATAQEYARIAVERGEPGFVYAHHADYVAVLAYVNMFGPEEFVLDPDYLTDDNVELVDEL